MSEYQEENEDLTSESVEVLRERLTAMKRLIADRSNSSSSSHQTSNEEIWTNKPHHATSGIIDGNFLSIAFSGALVVIITVSVYAFYNLYHAILKKFPSHHTEL